MSMFFLGLDLFCFIYTCRYLFVDLVLLIYYLFIVTGNRKKILEQLEEQKKRMRGGGHVQSNAASGPSVASMNLGGSSMMSGHGMGFSTSSSVSMHGFFHAWLFLFTG